MSLNAQNEVLQIMAPKVMCGIASDIDESGYYSIMADGSPDASIIEQLVICIHWVDKEITVFEEYIGLMPVPQINADTIVNCFKDVLLYVNLRIQDTRGQCYDECSIMTGTKNGVAAQIKKRNENVCWCTATANHKILLSEIQWKLFHWWKTHLIDYKLIRRVLNERQNSTENRQNFWNKWNVISMYTIWTHQLWKSENLLSNKVDCPSCTSKCYSDELWNFYEAVGMRTWQC